MLDKDMICPVCGRSDIYFPLKNDTNYNTFDEENLINKNFNQNLNNISINSYDHKFQYNPIKKNNSISTYSIDNFKFSIINAKKETNINKNAKEEIND